MRLYGEFSVVHVKSFSCSALDAQWIFYSHSKNQILCVGFASRKQILLIDFSLLDPFWFISPDASIFYPIKTQGLNSSEICLTLNAVPRLLMKIWFVVSSHWRRWTFCMQWSICPSSGLYLGTGQEQTLDQIQSSTLVRYSTSLIFSSRVSLQ